MFFTVQAEQQQQQQLVFWFLSEKGSSSEPKKTTDSKLTPLSTSRLCTLFMPASQPEPLSSSCPSLCGIRSVAPPSHCPLLTPIQYLKEDPHMNRINNSLQLFGQICRNKLLQCTHLILLLNKVNFPLTSINACLQLHSARKDGSAVAENGSRH